MLKRGSPPTPSFSFCFGHFSVFFFRLDEFVMSFTRVFVLYFHYGPRGPCFSSYCPGPGPAAAMDFVRGIASEKGLSVHSGTGRPSGRRWIRRGFSFAWPWRLACLPWPAPGMDMYGRKSSEKGVDLALVLDCSKSMLARDISPFPPGSGQKGDPGSVGPDAQGDRAALVTFRRRRLSPGPPDPGPFRVQPLSPVGPARKPAPGRHRPGRGRGHLPEGPEGEKRRRQGHHPHHRRRGHG